MKLTDKQREEVLERLEDYVIKTVGQWAATEPAAFRVYISEAEAYYEMSDEELAEIYEERFGETLEEDK